MFQATRIYVMCRLKEMRCVVCVSGYKDIRDVHSSVEGNEVCCVCFRLQGIYVMCIRRLKEMRCVVCVSGYKDIRDVHSSVSGYKDIRDAFVG